LATTNNRIGAKVRRCNDESDADGSGYRVCFDCSGVSQKGAPGGAADAAAARRRPGSGSNLPRPPAPPEPVREPPIVPPEPVPADAISSASLDDLNRSSPLKPVFFELDSAELSAVRAEGARRKRRVVEALRELDRDG
jgi:hypothetical protein